MPTIRPILCQTLALCSLALAGPALAQPDWPVGKGEGLSFIGTINQAYLHYDDGTESRGFLTVDNATNNLGSNLGVLYGGHFGGGTPYDLRLQVGVTPRPSDEVSLQNPAGPSFTIDEQDIWYAEIRLQQANGGTFYIGQGDMTANLSEPDYSGTTVISGPNVSYIAGDMLLRYLDGTLSGRTLNEAIGTFDSGRRFRLRYDSPTWHGLAASGSIGWNLTDTPANSCCTNLDDNSTYIDLQGSYTHTGAVWDYQAVLALTGLGEGEYAGVASFGYIHKPSGLNMMIVASHSSIDKHYVYVKAGIVRDIFSFGATAFSIEWYNNGNWAVEGAEEETYGASLVQNIDAANLQIYASYRDFDNYTNWVMPNEDFQTSTAFAAGLRWTF